MANKTIPELSEIDLESLTADHLLVLDIGTETFKVRMSTLADFFLNSNRFPIEVEFDGVETGEKTVDVSAQVADAQLMIWALKKPAGGSTDGEQCAVTIKTPDAGTVVIDTGDFALDAGTYTLLGV